MYESVMEEIGKPIVFNICMLGAVIRLTNVVKPKSVLMILERRIPADFLEMNRKALNIGIKLAETATAS
jgi:2-oxoglutarate ferredoxin oxidoreductase subunit gamma